MLLILLCLTPSVAWLRRVTSRMEWDVRIPVFCMGILIISIRALRHVRSLRLRPSSIGVEGLLTVLRWVTLVDLLRRAASFKSSKLPRYQLLAVPGRPQLGRFGRLQVHHQRDETQRRPKQFNRLDKARRAE
jgi:hypothetical protein